MELRPHDRIKLRLAWGETAEARVVNVEATRVLVSGEASYRRALARDEEPLAELAFRDEDVLAVLERAKPG